MLEEKRERERELFFSLFFFFFHTRCVMHVSFSSSLHVCLCAHVCCKSVVRPLLSYLLQCMQAALGAAEERALEVVALWLVADVLSSRHACVCVQARQEAKDAQVQGEAVTETDRSLFMIPSLGRCMRIPMVYVWVSTRKTTQ